MSDLVPDGWISNTVAELAERVKPGPFGSSLTKSMYVPSGFKVYGQEQVISGNTKVGNYYIDKEKFDELSVFKVAAGDILISLVGTFGRILTIPDDFHEGIINPRLLLLRFSKEKFDTAFIAQQFQSRLVTSQLELLQQGGTMGVLSATTLKPVKLNIPPLPEQQKIAAILSSVDEVIEKTQAQINKLKDLKTGMMQELLSPREGQAATISNPQGKSKNGLYHTEFKDSPLGRIPVGWEVRYLQDVATIQTGAAKNSKAVGDFVEMPYLRVANVQDGYLDLSEIKNINIEKHRVERFLLRNNDVLVNEGGDFDKLGRGSIWHNQVNPCVHQNHVFVVRTNQDSLLPMFFNHLSGSQHGKKYYMGCAKQTTNLASINSSQLKKFPVLLPPIDEQYLICEAINSIDGKINSVLTKLTATQQIKKALMQDLLTGKVRVTVPSHPCDHGISASMHVTVDAS